jgi:hypothetical protein
MAGPKIPSIVDLSGINRPIFSSVSKRITCLFIENRKAELWRPFAAEALFVMGNWRK